MSAGRYIRRLISLASDDAGDQSRDDELVALSASLAALAGQRGVPFVSVIEALRGSRAWTGEAAAGDGAHPVAGGYEEFARLVLAAGFVDWLC